MIFFISSCSHEKPVEIVEFSPSDYKVQFFSDKSDLELEDEYLSAILDLKNSYPSLINKIELKETSVSAIKADSITETPALVITKDGQTITKLSGQTSKSDVLSELKKIVDAEKAL